MNHKNARILKLLAKGLTTEQIAKKLGYQSIDAAKERIQQAVKAGETNRVALGMDPD